MRHSSQQRRGGDLPRKVRRAIGAHGLLRRGDHVLAAVSGGADSMALMRVLHELAPALGLRVSVGHVNHGLRGAGSDGDQAFVRDQAAGLGLPFHVARADVRSLARRRRISIEMAARDARYRALVRMARLAGAHAVATAHTADDVAETLLLRLARGAGRSGLGGIAWRSLRDGIAIVRPLLGAGRGEILRHLEARSQTWREDPSNADAAHLRNRVRHEVLPMLEARLNPRVRTALCRAAEVMRGEDEWLDAQAALALKTSRVVGEPPGVLDAARLAALHVSIRRRVLILWLLKGGVPADGVDFGAVGRIEALLGSTRGARRTPIGGGWTVHREYGRLALRPDDGGGPFETPVRTPGVTVVREAGIRIATRLRRGVVRPGRTTPGRMPACASIRYDPASDPPLVARSWRPGDRIRPLGLDGSKKIQDLFVDAKLPPAERNRIPLFVCKGEIVWVPGYRVCRSRAVPDGCRSVLQITVERGGFACNRPSLAGLCKVLE